MEGRRSQRSEVGGRSGRDAVGTRRRGRLRYFSPDQIEAKKRNGPAVMVLLIDGPLRPQVVDEDEPVAGQREKIEDGRWKTGHVTLTADYETTAKSRNQRTVFNAEIGTAGLRDH